MSTLSNLDKDEINKSLKERKDCYMVNFFLYLTTPLLNIIFVVSTCACFQENHNNSCITTKKRITRHFTSTPLNGVWYPQRD